MENETIKKEIIEEIEKKYKIDSYRKVVEKIVDILRPRIHSYVEIIKDMMAAAVLIASIGAAIIGVLIFYPYILALFQ